MAENYQSTLIGIGLTFTTQHKISIRLNMGLTFKYMVLSTSPTYKYFAFNR